MSSRVNINVGIEIKADKFKSVKEYVREFEDKSGLKNVVKNEPKELSKVKQRVEEMEKVNVGKNITNIQKVWAQKKNGLFGWISSSVGVLTGYKQQKGNETS